MVWHIDMLKIEEKNLLQAFFKNSTEVIVHNFTLYIKSKQTFLTLMKAFDNLFYFSGKKIALICLFHDKLSKNS